MNKSETINFIRIIQSEHADYWQQKASEMKKYRDVYECKFWRAHDYDSSMIRVETPDSYTYIESYIASLFTRAPAVVIGKDVAANEGTPANPEAAQAIANRWLYQRENKLKMLHVWLSFTTIQH